MANGIELMLIVQPGEEERGMSDSPMSWEVYQLTKTL